MRAHPRFTSLLLVSSALLAACGGGDGGTGTPACAVSSVSVAPATASVPVNDTLRLTPSIAATNCSSTPTTWSSSNSSIASVSASETVLGVAAGGPVTMTATAGGISGTASIQVTPAAIASVTLTAANAAVPETDTVQVTATVRDSKGNALTGRTLNWSSSDPLVMRVDTIGCVVKDSDPLKPLAP